MLDIEDYKAVFKGGHYSPGLCRDILENKAQLGDLYFFVRLLELLHIKARNLYPPKGETQLRDLHKRIIDAPITLHYKHCLLFYLLKDLAASYHGKHALSTGFAQEVHLDKRFWTFIEGIWELDHLQWETAVENLTHPAIIPTFPDEILLALMYRRKTMSVMTEEDVLPLAYYNCAKPPLANEEARTVFTKYMAARNVTETYHWIHTRPDHEQKSLLEAVLEQTLSGEAWGASRTDHLYSRQDKAAEVVGLPLSEEKEQWVEHFLTEGKGRALHAAKDTVLMRKLAMGRLQEFAVGEVYRGRNVDGINWESLREGVKRGLGPRKDEPTFAF